MARVELEAVAASRGLALGRARVVYPTHFEVELDPISPREVPGEVARFGAALDAAKRELASLRARTKGALARDVAEFIDAHALMLDDPDLAEGVPDRIRKGYLRATAAHTTYRDRLAARCDAIADP
jgi:phosphoenolpyruvate-protein phosphotransferase (PTS system enzyme I)